MKKNRSKGGIRTIELNMDSDSIWNEITVDFYDPNFTIKFDDKGESRPTLESQEEIDRIQKLIKNILSE